MDMASAVSASAIRILCLRYTDLRADPPYPGLNRILLEPRFLSGSSPAS